MTTRETNFVWWKCPLRSQNNTSEPLIIKGKWKATWVIFPFSCGALWCEHFFFSKNHLQCDNYCRLKGFKWIFSLWVSFRNIFFRPKSIHILTYLHFYLQPWHKSACSAFPKEKSFTKCDGRHRCCRGFVKIWNGKWFSPQDCFLRTEKVVK